MGGCLFAVGGLVLLFGDSVQRGIEQAAGAAGQHSALHCACSGLLHPSPAQREVVHWLQPPLRLLLLLLLTGPSSAASIPPCRRRTLRKAPAPHAPRLAWSQCPACRPAEAGLPQARP